MGFLGPTYLVVLLLGVGTVAALTGFIAATIAQRSNRRSRKIFAVGFTCGLLAGAILRRRHRGASGFAARSLRLTSSPGRLGLPAQWPRRVRHSVWGLR